MMKTLILDADGTLLNTNKAMIRSMNPFIKEVSQKVYEDTPVTDWNYASVFPQKYLRYVDILFSSKLLFDNMELFPNVKETLGDLHDKGVEIIICTIGTKDNIKYKLDYLDKVLPFIDVVPIVKKDKVVMNKGIINMENSVFIDDNINNILSSNADYRILYKHNNIDTDYNKGWEGYITTSWEDEKFLKDLYYYLGVDI